MTSRIRLSGSPITPVTKSRRSFRRHSRQPVAATTTSGGLGPSTSKRDAVGNYFHRPFAAAHPPAVRAKRSEGREAGFGDGLVLLPSRR